MPAPKAGSHRLPKSWKPLIPFCIFVLGSAIPSMLLMTITPEQSKAYFGSNSKAAVIRSVFQCVGALITLFTTGLMGLIADTVGRYPLFVASSFAHVIPFILQCIFSPGNMYWYEASSNIVPALVGSATMGNAALVIICVGDLFVEEERAAPMIVTIAMYFIGLVCAFIPAAIGMSNEMTSMVACGIAFLVFMFVALGGIPETLKESNRRTHNMARDNIYDHDAHSTSEERISKLDIVLQELKQPLAPLKYVAKSRLLVALTSVAICLVASTAGAESITFFYYNACCGFTKKDNALMMGTLGVVALLYTFLVMPVLLKHLHTVTVVNIALVAIVLHAIAVSFATETWELIGIVTPLSGVSLMAFGLMSQLASSCASAEEQGVVLGSLAAFKGICHAVAPVVSAQLFSFGEGDAHFPQLPWVALGAIAFIGVLLCQFFLRPLLLEAASQLEESPRALKDEEDGFTVDCSDCSSLASDLDDPKSTPLLPAACGVHVTDEEPLPPNSFDNAER